MKPQNKTDSEKLNNDPATEGAEEAVKDGQESAAVSGAENNPQPDGEITESTDVNTDADDALEHFGTRTVAPPKKRKFGWVGYVALLIVIGLSVWMMLKIVMADADEYISFGEVFAAGNWRFGVISFAVLIVIIACICFEYVVVIKATTNKFALGTGIKVALLGKFYDNITPLASGGQPMQIYYLHKKGFSGGVSSAVVLIKYFVNMFCWLLCALLLMACNIGVLSQIADQTWAQVIKIVGWIGLALNLLLPTMIVLFAVLPRFANACTSGLVGLGTKIKIVKDKDKTMGKALNTVNDFRSSIAIMSKKPLNFLALIALCFAEVLLTFAFPYCILRMFSAIGAEQGFGMLIQVMALYAFVQQSVAIIPTPGNSGAMEKVIMEALSAVAGGAVLMWSVLTWRMVVYYIYIVIGICLTLYEMFRKIYRKNKAKKLAAQSRQSENLVQSSSEDDEKPLT